MQTTSFGPPVLKLNEELIAHRMEVSVQKCKNWEQSKRSARLQSLDVLFMFQRGPHKFLHGTYPRVTAVFAKRLLSIVLVVIQKHRGENYARILLRSVDKLDIALHSSFLTFLLLVSNIHRTVTVPGSIRIPNENSLDYDMNDSIAPRYTIFETEGFPCGTFHRFTSNGNRCTLPLAFEQYTHPVYTDRSNPSDFSPSDRNLFTNLLYFNHRFSLASHFFGAFSHIGLEARRMLCTRGAAPLQLPAFSSYSHKMSSPDLRLPYTSVYGEKDEGYSDTSEYSLRLTCMDDGEALQWLRNLFAFATKEILDFLLSELYPFLADSHPVLCSSSKSSTTVMPPEPNGGRCCWTNRGFCIPCKELPFLTESGPWGSLALFTAFSQRFSLLSSIPHEDATHPLLSNVTPSSFLNDLEFVELRNSFYRDLLLLRMGTQSSRFVWDLSPGKEEQNCNGPLVGHFRYCSSSFDAFVLGISESVLTNLMHIHLVCGTYYRRLCWFARKLVPLTLVPGQMWQGLTWTCFVHATSTWLSWYEEALQHFLQQLNTLSETRVSTVIDREPPGLLKFHKRLRILTDRILFMCKVCMLVDTNDYPLLQLSGMDLLVHLASKCTQSVCSPSESMARFLFQRACQPFLTFLESLLLDGVYTESGVDFNVFTVSQNISERDASFWADAFRLNSVRSNASSTAGFLDLLPVEFRQCILRCAKSVRLLLLMDPNHYIFKARAQFPGLQLRISSRKLSEQRQAFSRYLELLRNSAQHSLSTWFQSLSEFLAQRQTNLKRVLQARELHMTSLKEQSRLASNCQLSRQKQSLAQFNHAMQVAGEHRSLSCDDVGDETQLNGKAEAFAKKVIPTDRKDPEADYGIQMRNTLLHRSEAERCLKESHQLNTFLIKSCLKTEAFHVAHPFISAINGGVENSSSGSCASLVDPTCNSYVLTADPSDATAAAPSGSVELDDTERATLHCAVRETSDSPSDIYNRVRQRPVSTFNPVDHMSSLLYPEGSAVQTTTTNIVTHSTNEQGVSDRACEPRTRFHERNPHGVSSTSTIQHILYGSGSGPACRPSAWEAQRAVRDVEEAAKFSREPDASTFYREALEPHPETCSLAFTIVFPDCDQSLFVDPLRITRLRTPSDRPESHDIPPPCASHAAPLDALINSAIVQPLTSYIHLVDAALCNQFLLNHGLLEHLSCLRQLYFLGHNEFCELLVDGLFQQGTGPITNQSILHEATFLRDLIRSATSRFLASTDESSDFKQFHFWTTDCTPLIIRASIDLVPNKRKRVPKWSTDGVPVAPFDHITMVYGAPWPLNIFLNNRVMHKYNLIFRHLIHVKFAVWLLNGIYCWLRHNGHLNTARAFTLSGIHNITLWSHEMNQVLRGVESYLTNQAIKVSWAEFIARINDSMEASQRTNRNTQFILNAEHVVHLDDLMSLHDTYVDNIVKCCLLDPANRELHQVFQGLLSCVHWFHKVLFSGRLVSAAPNGPFRHSRLDELHAAHQSFTQHARFLRRRVGRLLSAPGTDRAGCSLNQFFLVLGLNDFYDNSPQSTLSLQLQSAH